MPKISIIIPVYNSENTLRRCLNSVLAQTFTDYECLLIDDGSTDDSGRICDEYAEKDKRVRVFHKTNGGVSSARNVGLENSKGEFLVFVDSDDCMYPEMCSVLLGKCELDGSECVVCGARESDSGVWVASRNVDYCSLDGFLADFPDWVNTELFSPVWNKIYKKCLINSCFPLDTSFGEDLIFNLKYLSQCSRISVITDILCFHEKGNSLSLTHQVYPKRLFEVEKVFLALQHFGGSSCNQIVNKCLRDIAVYLMAIIKSKNFYAWKSEVGRWRKCSFINQVQICSSNLHWKSKLFLVLVKFGWLGLIKSYCDLKG